MLTSATNSNQIPLTVRQNKQALPGRVPKPSFAVYSLHRKHLNLDYSLKTTESVDLCVYIQVIGKHYGSVLSAFSMCPKMLPT